MRVGPRGAAPQKITLSEDSVSLVTDGLLAKKLTRGGTSCSAVGWGAGKTRSVAFS